jgi:hypothetical protein
MKTVSVILSLLLIASCAFKDNEGKDEANREDLERLQDSRAKLEPIKGTWIGTLSRSGKRISVSLRIEEYLSQDRRNDSGNIVFNADPSATFYSTKDASYAPETLLGQYSPENGELIFIKAPTTNPNADDIESMNLVFDGTKLSGNLKARGYVVGTLEFSNRITTNDSAEDLFDEYNRLLKLQYKPLLGSFRGLIKETNNPRAKQYFVCVELYTYEVPTSNGKTQAALGASYVREDDRNGGFFKILKANYNIRTVIPQLSMTSQFQDQPRPNQYQVEMNLVPTFRSENKIQSLEGTHINKLYGIVSKIKLEPFNRPCPRPN